MHKITLDKERIRKEIVLAKLKISSEEKQFLSQDVMMTLEIVGSFIDAKNILIYNSLADEVETLPFIKKWSDSKSFYLPAIVKDNLVFRVYNSKTTFQNSGLGVQEPSGENLMDYKKIDLIIVPGVAFDRKKNRLGRGKGYYDHFLKNKSIPTIGICFDFQLLDNVPVDENDVKMDMIVSENDFIW